MENAQEDDSDPESMAGPGVVLDLIERWRSLDLPRMDDASIEAELRELMTGLRSVVVSSREIRGIRTVKRARIKRRKNAENDKDWPWRNLQHLIHPVGSWVPLGRCNVEGDSALYCANEFVTALREIRAVEGDEVVLVGYGLVNAKLAKVVGPFSPTPIDSDEPIFEGDELVSYQLVRDFIRSEFIKPVGTETRHLYRVSAAICREWFAESFDGWIYPSVESPARECMAVRATSVEKCIVVKGATLARVFAVQGRCFAVETLRKAIIHDDETVEWGPRIHQTKWLCDCERTSHVVPTPVVHSSLFDWVKERFGRLW